jgi:hypothetical protein
LFIDRHSPAIVALVTQKSNRRQAADSCVNAQTLYGLLCKNSATKLPFHRLGRRCLKDCF